MKLYLKQRLDVEMRESAGRWIWEGAGMLRFVLWVIIMALNRRVFPTSVAHNKAVLDKKAGLQKKKLKSLIIGLATEESLNRTSNTPAGTFHTGKTQPGRFW